MKHLLLATAAFITAATLTYTGTLPKEIAAPWLVTLISMTLLWRTSSRTTRQTQRADHLHASNLSSTYLIGAWVAYLGNVAQSQAITAAGNAICVAVLAAGALAFLSVMVKERRNA